MTYTGDRRGVPWSAQEVADLIALLRSGTARTEAAHMLGRTPGALDAAAYRLLRPGDRPVSRSYAWTVLVEEVKTSTAKTDWWARYLQGRPPPRPSRSSTYEGSRADLVTLDHTHPGEIDLGVLVLEAVNELRNNDDRELLLRRLGVVDRPLTLHEIADERGVTAERIRQREARALARINIATRREGSAARTLAAAVNYLADSDAVLILQLIDTAETWFQTSPVWLARTVYRMVDRNSDEIALLANLVSHHLSERRAGLRDQRRQQFHQQRLNSYVDKWITDAAWPTDPDVTDQPSAAPLRHRMPDPSRGGSFHSKKLDRTVYFESGLEELVFQTAELSSRIRSYQEQPCRIEYAGTDDNHLYYPDLLVALTDGRSLLIEIKPLALMAVTANRIKSAAAQRFAAKHGWGWVSVADRGQTFADLRRYKLHPSVSELFARALLHGPLTWPALQQLRKQRAFSTTTDVPAYAVQTDTPLITTPYQLGF